MIGTTSGDVIKGSELNVRTRNDLDTSGDFIEGSELNVRTRNDWDN